jgi:predicted 3-demethylubiquinone-9 3-methyltransferase (glyoxalase superfamily)
MVLAVATHLMFEGVAEEAIDFYGSLFPDVKVRQLERYGPGEQGAEGSVKHATFTLAGQNFIAIDSPIEHEFTFTPAMSIFVDCESETELDEAFAQLATGGKILMPPDNYGFSRRFAWLQDRYGVSWQLNLP